MVVAGEECVLQHKLVVCDLIIKSVKETFFHRAKRNLLQMLDRIRRQRTDVRQNQDAEDKGPCLKGFLLESSDRVCEWAKGTIRHQETSWSNDMVDNAIKEK